MRKIMLLALTALMTLAVALPAGAKPDKPDKAADPVKVWMCHFDGHEPDAPFVAGGTTFNGDYVMSAQDLDPLSETPTEFQRKLCEDDRGGRVLHVSSRGAVNGHRVVNPGWISGYRS